MSDSETKEKIADKIKSGCPLRPLLKKPCPHFGATNSCRDCRYDWLTLASDVIDCFSSRRAAYEVEREKRKQFEKIVDDFACVIQAIIERRGVSGENKDNEGKKG